MAAHRYKNHSTAKQAGNLPLSLEDFKKAVDYVDNYDDVLEVIPTKKGTRILLGKQINGHSVITEIVSEPSKSLRLKNMWKLDTDTYLSRYNGVIKEKAPMLTTSQPKNGETYYQPSDMLSTQSISDSVENVKLKDLGADTARPNQTIAEARAKYGTYDGNVPKETELGKVTQGTSTVYNSPISNDEMKKVISENIEEGSYWTRRTTNKNNLDKAADAIKENRVDKETESFLDIGRKDRAVKSEDIAMGYQLAKEHLQYSPIQRVTEN